MCVIIEKTDNLSELSRYKLVLSLEAIINEIVHLQFFGKNSGNSVKKKVNI
jgi:hypothetical protein